MNAHAKWIEAWQGLEGRALVKAVLSERSLRVAVASSFGTESAVLLDLVARVDPSTPVIFVDTKKLFAETLAYRDTLTRHLDLLDVRVVQPSAAMVTNMDPHGTLYQSDPDGCCQARKVTPYAQAVSDFEVLITGRKRHHGDGRETLPTVETAGLHIKINPLAHMNATDIEAQFAKRKLPRHPLADVGYRSIGCEPCTSKSCPSRGARAGRWAGHTKTECGIHNHNSFDILNLSQSLGGQE